jgi:signal transduction histidine kinase
MLAGVVILLIIAIATILHDPFDFDDRPHIVRLLKLALSSVQSDTAVDMAERMWAQVKLAEADDLSTMPAQEWEQTSKFFLTHNVGCMALQVLDRAHNRRRIVEVPEAVGLTSSIDFNDPKRDRVLETAATSTNRVSTAPIRLPNGRRAYLIAVPNSAGGETVGFLVAICDIEKSLDAMLSEFKGLGFSVAVLDDSGQLYASGSPEHRREWGQIAPVHLPGVDWWVEVWPKPEMLAETRSPFLELVAIFTALLILLLSSTLHFGRVASAKSVALQKAHDQLEQRVRERTSELQQTNEALRNLSAHVLYLQDEERRRIARELHDSTVQALTAVKINVSSVMKMAAPTDSSSRTLLQQSVQLTEDALNEIRTMSYLLHPPILEDFGLESALSWYAAGFSERSGVETRVQIDPNLGRFSRELELILFRIVQEALGNIHRHSGSPTAEIILSRTSTDVTLVARDEGCGLPENVVDPKPDSVPLVGVGIAGMRERVRLFGGTLQIASTSNGTSVRVVLPISERHAAQQEAD